MRRGGGTAWPHWLAHTHTICLQAPASTTVSVFYRVFLLDSPQASKATTRPARSRCLLPGPSLPPISGKCFYYYITPQYHTPRDVRPRVVTSDEAALRHTHCNLTGAISRPNRLCAVRWSGWLWSCSGPSSAEYRWRCCDLPPTHGPDSRFVRNPLPSPACRPDSQWAEHSVSMTMISSSAPPWRPSSPPSASSRPVRR